MNKVLVYTRHILPYSQTFIREQVRAMQAWQPILVGERRTPGGLPLNGLETRILWSEVPRPLADLARRLIALVPRPNRSLLSLLLNERASVLHAHFGTDAALIWPTLRLLDMPILVTLHGYDINTYEEWWTSGRGGPEFIRYPKTLRAMARDRRVRFIAVSEAIRRRAIEFGLPPDRIGVHFIGVDIGRFRPGPAPLTKRPSRILFVGRQVEKKGCETLLHAFKLVQQRISTAELVVIGDGPLLGHHKRLASELGLRTRFVGAMSPDAVVDQLHQARVFCLPSITAANGDAEGLPISILEAQSSGIPVVISRSGGSDEGIVEGETGYCVEGGTPDEMADRLVQLLSDDEALVAMGQAARMHMERTFDLTACTAALESAYNDAVNAYGH